MISNKSSCDFLKRNTVIAFWSQDVQTSALVVEWNSVSVGAVTCEGPDSVRADSAKWITRLAHQALIQIYNIRWTTIRSSAHRSVREEWGNRPNRLIQVWPMVALWTGGSMCPRWPQTKKRPIPANDKSCFSPVWQGSEIRWCLTSQIYCLPSSSVWAQKSDFWCSTATSPVPW